LYSSLLTIGDAKSGNVACVGNIANESGVLLRKTERKKAVRNGRFNIGHYAISVTETVVKIHLVQTNEKNRHILRKIKNE
jgi:hypothetical protein